LICGADRASTPLHLAAELALERRAPPRVTRVRMVAPLRLTVRSAVQLSVAQFPGWAHASLHD